MRDATRDTTAMLVQVACSCKPRGKNTYSLTHSLLVQASSSGSSDADDAEPLRVVLVAPPEGLPLLRPPILGVSDALSRPAKWAFLATNAPYWAVAVATWARASPLLVNAAAPCLLGVCSSIVFHACILSTLALASTYWHGAQLQLLYPLYRCLHQPRWLRRLILGDVICAVLTFSVGLACFGVRRVMIWLSAPLLIFFASGCAKRRRAYGPYALGHGLWHVLSAVAIWGIVLSDVRFVGPPGPARQPGEEAEGMVSPWVAKVKFDW